MEDSLATLIEFGVPVKSIVDVGVQGGTKPLIKLFADRTHYLFEPVDDYFRGIAAKYNSIAHELFHVALSDEDGTAWQLGISRDGSGKVTHSQISHSKVTREEQPLLVDCKPVTKARLDSVLGSKEIAKPYLLKIDVDGHELPILHGAVSSMRDASIVVVEATISTILSRASFIAENGFRLFDVVDLSYYHRTLSQVDLVFVRQDLVAANDNLRPWETKSFAWSNWQPLNEKFWQNNMTSGIR
jgi:FkbM family methyltransferase